MKRTTTCGALRKADAGKTVTLNGWMHRKREHGGITFINIRDRYGITQVVIDENAPAELKAIVDEVKSEYCIAVEGTVRARPDTMVNKDMVTGEIEILASKMQILSRCEVLPFQIDDRSDAKEDTRLQYRYLDLRSFSMQRKMKLRNEVAYATREFLTSQEFYEIDTPTLIKETPEGARSFLVPSRIHAGKFYALPQSPQLYKQILMVGGMDRYFQIARCYRDEDSRGDRQLEFDQIDMEMSFVTREDVLLVVEGLVRHIFRKTMNIDLPEHFYRISYDDAMNLYGSDKPDLRFGMEMQDFAPYARKGSFQAFTEVLESKKGAVKALVAPRCSEYSRKQITDLEEVAKVYGARGLAWMKVVNGALEGGVSKFYEPVAKEIITGLKAADGDLILLVGDKSFKTAVTSLGAVRSRLGDLLNLKNPDEYKFAWVLDFPLFEYNEEEQKWDPAHHMFTMPQAQYLPTLEQNPGEVKGDLYDLVLNGYEMASGSIRIHDPELQKRIFKIVGYPEEDAMARFGFLVEAFKYGPPPHGGLAIGFDRLVMLMAHENTIREVIPFPKNTFGVSPMDDSPSYVYGKQIDELHIKVVMPEEKK